MKQQSGRSLIEVIGVLAIGGMMSVAALGLFNMLRSDMALADAESKLKSIAENTKLLWEPRGTYAGASVEVLIQEGAFESERAPIGGDTWSIVASADGQSFSINLVDLTYEECEYFSIKKLDWVSAILVNGFEETHSRGTDNCFKSDTNQVSLVVE